MSVKFLSGSTLWRAQDGMGWMDGWIDHSWGLTATLAEVSNARDRETKKTRTIMVSFVPKSPLHDSHQL